MPMRTDRKAPRSMTSCRLPLSQNSSSSHVSSNCLPSDCSSGGAQNIVGLQIAGQRGRSVLVTTAAVCWTVRVTQCVYEPQQIPAHEGCCEVAEGMARAADKGYVPRRRKQRTKKRKGNADVRNAP